MVHRISPRRIAKRQRIAARAALPQAHHPLPGIGRDRLLAFEADFAGTIVLPGDPDYDKDRQEANPAFEAWPKLICYCVVENDVALCLGFARETGLDFVVRSGGHSTAGYSICNGMIIDLSRLNGVMVNEASARLFAQPGADWDTVNAALDPTGLHVPTGACGNVCVGGFVQGGGYGYTSRMFGIQCDSVTALRVMLWNGGIVTANAAQNADLFWAMRGGTGGNFGVLLGVTYALHALPSVWAYAIAWPADKAAAVLQMQQAQYTRNGAAPQLGYMMNLGYDPCGQPVALMQGMWCGSQNDGMAALQPLLALGHSRLWSNTGPYGQMDEWLDNNPYPMPNPGPGTREDKVSGYVARPLSLAEWQGVADRAFAQRPEAGYVMYTEPYGGATMTPPPGGNAFVHRQVDMNLVFDAFWAPSGEGKAAAEAWLASQWTGMQPFFSGAIYQNYPRASYTDYRRAYWGAAFPGLLAVKGKYDPQGLFRFPQDISPPPGAAAPGDGAGVPGLAAPITYDRAPR